MRYRYEVKRMKRTPEELEHLKEIFKDKRDEFGDLIYNENDLDTLYKEPTVDMFCPKCGYEQPVEHMLLVQLNYGMKGLHSLSCPECSHTKKRGVLYPRNITDLDGNPISYKDVLKNK
jgi:hypothetical protein